MDVIIGPNISFRVQVVINTVYLSCSLDSSLYCGPVLSCRNPFCHQVLKVTIIQEKQYQPKPVSISNGVLPD